MSEDLQQSISCLKPLADAVVEAASALNAAMQAAAGEGLSVRVEVLPAEGGGGDEAPMVRVRVSRQIA